MQSVRGRIKRLERLFGSDAPEDEWGRQLRSEQRRRSQLRNAHLKLVRGLWQPIDPQRAEQIDAFNMAEHWAALPAEIKEKVRQAARKLLVREIARQGRKFD